MISQSHINHIRVIINEMYLYWDRPKIMIGLMSLGQDEVKSNLFSNTVQTIPKL